MRRDHDDHPADRYYTGFPLTVIGGAMVAIITYLIIGEHILEDRRNQARVFVPIATEAVIARR
ncbi:hypothetical protein [Rhizobium mesosinicum]|uniref:Uncharacterized protein n=1 Tax=Rhizobium mesosinicum TaxID=335017 RepID=A0ABS7GN01_9HYPH|nr:hypothetical protein [Rhizobium mesosinicum]MBW9051031.1 hypothetical protein [Rhizobium mesosinicum]